MHKYLKIERYLRKDFKYNDVENELLEICAKILFDYEGSEGKEASWKCSLHLSIF